MTFREEDLAAHLAAFASSIEPYNDIDKMTDRLPAVKYRRTPGCRPNGEENRYGARYVNTTIEGAPDGKLKGKNVVLKDNMPLAGVPMMNGASTLEGYVPDVDATIAHPDRRDRRHAREHDNAQRVDGEEALLVGLMLVGRFYDESTIYNAARGFEQKIDWKGITA